MNASTLTTLNDQVQQLLQTNSLSDPRLKANLRKVKIAVYSSPQLEKQSNEFLMQALRFSELNLLYILATLNEKDYSMAIDNVKFFYENSLTRVQSPNKSQFIAIHLLHLLSSNQSEEFFTKLESLTAAELSDSYVKYVLLLHNSIEAGNYRQIFQLKKDNPLQCFTPFLNRISETVRTEIAKSAEKAYTHLSLRDAISVFQVESQAELKKFVQHFSENSQQNVRWVVSDKEIIFEKDSNHKIKFNSEDLIAKTLLYARELEKIA